MTCKKYRKSMSAYLDGEISPSKQAKLSQHLNSCPSCRSYFENLKVIQDKIVSIEPVEIPAEYDQKARALIVQRIAAEQVMMAKAKKKPSFQLMQKRWLMAFPAFLMIILAALLYYQVLKKPGHFNESNYFNFQEPFELIDAKIEIDDEAMVAFNDLIEQEIIDLTLSEIDYHSFVEYLYLSLEDLQDEEKENLLREIFRTQQENGL